VIQRELDREDPRVGHQPVRRLEAVHATPAAWDANGAALVSANSQVHLGGDQRRATLEDPPGWCVSDVGIPNGPVSLVWLSA